MTPFLDAVLAGLLAASEDARTVRLDDIGDAIGTAPVTADAIDALIDALERAGRKVGGAEGLSGVEALHRVVDAARQLVAQGQRPKVTDLVHATGLAEGEVRKALLFARVLGR